MLHIIVSAGCFTYCVVLKFLLSWEYFALSYVAEKLA
jgi:hypothetical protein